MASVLQSIESLLAVMGPHPAQFVRSFDPVRERWKFEPLTCPYCQNSDRSRITSFATPDGQYRVYACDVCRRYLKAYDARRASRPVMQVVDSIATLPLDAAAIQRGYLG